jgi:penicillin-binding protein 1A
MTGGSLPAQTWREIMVVAHQGVEVKEVPGIGMGQKQPPTAQAAAARTAAAPKIIDTKPGPPPVLTKRGADVLVRIEKQLDDASKTAAKTSATEPPKPTRPLSSTSVTFPDSFAAATPGDQPAPAGRKN